MQLKRLQTNLTVTTKRQGVSSLPVGTTTRANGLVETMSLTVTTVLLANGSKTASFTVLVNRVDDPVDAGITADSLMVGINKNDFEVLVGGILVNPV